MTLLTFILENAPAYLVQKAVRRYDVKYLGYAMKLQVWGQFPEYRGHALKYGADLSEAFDAFKTDGTTLDVVNQEIVKIQSQLRIYSKYHPTYQELVTRHDALVTLNNILNEPIDNFLKLYKKAQKAKNNKISVVKKKERTFQLPA